MTGNFSLVGKAERISNTNKSSYSFQMFILAAVILVPLGFFIWYVINFANQASSRGSSSFSALADGFPVESNHYIPIDATTLRQTLLQELSSSPSKDAQSLNDVFDLISDVISLNHKSLSRSLLSDYDLFDPNCQSVKSRLTIDGSAPAAAELQFLDRFCSMMRLANFSVLTEAESEFSESGCFLLDVITETQWNLFDSELFQKFKSSGAASKHFQDISLPKVRYCCYAFHHTVFFLCI